MFNIKMLTIFYRISVADIRRPSKCGRSIKNVAGASTNPRGQLLAATPSHSHTQFFTSFHNSPGELTSFSAQFTSHIKYSVLGSRYLTIE